MQTVAFISPPACLEHDTGVGHPESIARLQALNTHIRDVGLLDDLLVLDARPVSEMELERAHDAQHVHRVAQAIAQGYAGLDGDTTISAHSWEAATMAAGAALTGLGCLAEEKARRVFCAVRPPGHHAEEDRAMGFCLFNNVAVAAAAAQASNMAERVLILDWDVHHGNGTQDIFDQSDSVFFYSMHQFPFYPGTGAAHEVGHGPGRGFTLNRPLPAGTGDDEYLRCLARDLDDIAKRFRPDLVIVSAGFDAHRDDPLAGMRLTSSCFQKMTRMVADFADTMCGGKLLSVLEGGYDLHALAESVVGHVAELRE